MSTLDKKDIQPIVVLREESEAAASAFLALRAAAADGPLDHVTVELIVIACQAVAGYEDTFRNHVRRLVGTGVPWATVRHAVRAPLGSTAGIFQVSRALTWLDELEAEQAASGG